MKTNQILYITIFSFTAITSITISPWCLFFVALVEFVKDNYEDEV